MIMASTSKRKLEPVLIQKPEWIHPNIGYIDHDQPIMMINGRQHYLINWNYPGYKDEYIDFSYVHKMEDVSKSKHIWHSPGEVPLSPKQHELAGVRRQEALKWVWKSRVSCRTQLEESSSKQRRIVEEDDTLELNIDPFSEVSLEERVQAAQKRPPKPLLEERLQASWKRPPKPPPEERLQASWKRPPKPPLEETLKCAPLQEGEQEDVQASWKRPPKPPPEERMKSPAPQEKSKQSSWWRWLIMEEDDEMFPCNIDPFSEELVY